MVAVNIEMSEAQLKAEKKAKKKAKKEKLALAEVGVDEAKPEKKKKKRKLEETVTSAPEVDNEVEPAKKKIRGKKKSEKKAEKAEVSKAEEDNASVTTSATSTGPKNQKALDDIEGLSKKSKQLLEAKGFKTLFEIQHRSFSTFLDGNDIVGKAKTGCGKTLAFVLPTVDRIIKENLSTFKRGRAPIVLCMAPTRELTQQIHRDYEWIAKGHGLKATVVYGGTSFGPQCQDFREGVDIVTATAGRILDHIKRETVKTDNIS